MRETENYLAIFYIAIIACPILLLIILIIVYNMKQDVTNGLNTTNQFLHQLVGLYKTNNEKNQEGIKKEISITPMPQKKICPQCKGDNKLENSFCMHCGQKLG